MRKHLQLILYGVVAALFVAAFVANPAAWATPSRHAANQTVPTRTPTQQWVPTDLPTEAPPTQPPGQATSTPLPPAATVAPGASPVAGTPAPSAGLVVTAEPVRTVGWPGADLSFTLTIANRGATAARQVALELALPAGLEPLPLTDSRAAWERDTLRLRLASLPAGGATTVRFTVRVGAGVIDPALVLRPIVTAPGLARATATVVIALPPVELPPTGAEPAGHER